MRKALLIAALIAAPAGAADPLGIGDPAPTLAVGEFVKGEPVKGFDKGKVYVVEFWATWCGPCIATIPHVTELQKKFPAATMIGVDVWERAKDAAELKGMVNKFVEKMGDKMDYRVCLDAFDGDEPKNGKMAETWMAAAEQGGIPAAFIVNGDGKIAWIGHPASMDKALAGVMAGDWDLAKAKADYKKVQEARAKMRAAQAKVAKVATKLRTAGKDPQAIVGILDEALAADPDLEPRFAPLKMESLVKASALDKALAYGDRLLGEVFKDDAMGLNQVAWPLVENPGDKPDPRLMKLAVRLAERADTLLGKKDAAVADTLGKAYFEAGEYQKAVEAQERAVKLEADGMNAGEMKERLKEFQKKLAEKADK